MFDGVRASLLTGLEPGAGIAARRAAECRAAGDEEIIMGEVEPGTAAIGDGTELAVVDEPGLPHRRGGVWRQIEVEVAILVHGNLAFA